LHAGRANRLIAASGDEGSLILIRGPECDKPLRDGVGLRDSSNELINQGEDAVEHSRIEDAEALKAIAFIERAQLEREGD
jgi:hypothetical protein